MLFEDPLVKDTLELTWQEVPEHFPHASLDVFVVMPNHMHAILHLNRPPVGSQHAGNLLEARAALLPGSLSVVIRSFKSASTKRLRERRLISGRIWQSNYHDRVIRTDRELDRVREYIALNPLNWQHDQDNLERTASVEYERAWNWLEAHT